MKWMASGRASPSRPPSRREDADGTTFRHDSARGQGRLVAFASEWCRQAGNRPLLRQRLAMRIPGQRIKRTRLIQTEKYVVAVEVVMVIPVDDPSEPCYESETVQLLREIKEHAERGDVAWLTQKGKVYAAVDAA